MELQLEYFLLLAAALFCIGIYGLTTSRNAVRVLMSIDGKPIATIEVRLCRDEKTRRLQNKVELVFHAPRSIQIDREEAISQNTSHDSSSCSDDETRSTTS